MNCYKVSAQPPVVYHQPQPLSNITVTRQVNVPPVPQGAQQGYPVRNTKTT